MSRVARLIVSMPKCQSLVPSKCGPQGATPSPFHPATRINVLLGLAAKKATTPCSSRLEELTLELLSHGKGSQQMLFWPQAIHRTTSWPELYTTTWHSTSVLPKTNTVRCSIILQSAPLLCRVECIKLSELLSSIDTEKFFRTFALPCTAAP
jgi:hypothetical protein